MSLIIKQNDSYLYIDEAKHRNENGPNSPTIENKTAHSIYKDPKDVRDFKTKILDLGFLDEDEAIQLGLIVPDGLESKYKDASELEKTKLPTKSENKNENININNENQLGSSELSVFSLKSYTQITESTMDKTTQQGEGSADVINASNKNIQVDSNECSIEKEVPVQCDNASSSRSIASPATCSKVDKLKNMQDKMNGYSSAVQKRGIIVNPHCCEDKLLPGYCSYSVKNINEYPEDFKHRCYKQHFIRTCHSCM